MRNTKLSVSSTHATKESVWSTWCSGGAGLIPIAHGNPCPTWETLLTRSGTSTPPILPLLVVCAAFRHLISFNCSDMSGRRLLSLRLHRLIAWKSILRRGAVLHTIQPMVLFFLFLFLPLLFVFVLMAIAALYKPGCAVSAADTSSV